MQKVITKYLGADSCYSAWIWKKGSALGFWSIVAFQGQICGFCLIRFGTFRNTLRQHINSKAPAPCGTTDTHLDRPPQPRVTRLSATYKLISWSIWSAISETQRNQFHQNQHNVFKFKLRQSKFNQEPTSLYSFVHSFLPSEHLQTLEPLKINCYNCWMLILIQLRWLALLCCWPCPCLYCSILSGCFDVSWPRTSCNPLNTRPRQIYIYIWSRVPCSQPPMGWGGMMPLWWWYVCMYACMHVCMYIYIFISIYMLHAFLYDSVCVRTHTYIQYM